MKKVPYPQSWKYFHIIVSRPESKTISLRELCSLATCDNNIETAYLRLKWIRKNADGTFDFTGPELLDEKAMADVRHHMNIIYKRVDSLYGPAKKSAHTAAASLLEEIELHKENEILYRTIGSASDADLFAELKRRGWDIPTQLRKNTV